MTMELRILGPVEIVSQETVVAMRGRPLTLLSLLLAERGRPVSVARAVEVLWGDRPPANPKNALQVVVARLRSALGEAAAVELRPGGYALVAARDAIDADRFESLLARGRTEAAAGDHAAAAATLREALALWRGHALAEVRDEPFARAEAARLEELRLEALEVRIDADLALGRASELVGELTGLVAEHPFREHLQGALMLALSRSGRQADALAAYTQARRSLRDGLGLEPGPELRELQRAVLNQEVSSARRSDPDPGPVGARSRVVPAVSFVGRRAELAEVTGLLLRGGRLLTLLGPGGTGKTRLALEVADGLREAFPDGIVLVELASVRDATQVEGAVARALARDVETPVATLETIAERAAGRHCLVVLDNAEHAVTAVAEVAAALTAVEGPRVLVTSRVRLGLREETGYEVPPLSPADAVALFVACARRLDAAFTPDDAVALLCARLDRLPLAIELAAARTTVFSASQLLDRLGERLDMVDAGPQAEDRHRSLRAATEWSLAHLSDDELRLFRRLAVFAGPVPFETVAMVCEAGPVELQALVERSLVQRSTPREPGATPLFAMLETIRQHAGELLAADDAELHHVRRRHAEAVAQRMSALAEAGAPPIEFERERQELTLALLAAREEPDGELELSLAAAAHRLWRLRGPYQEGAAVLAHALGRCPEGTARVRALLALGDLSSLGGDPVAAVVNAEAALAAARSRGDAPAQVRALNLLGNAAFGTGDLGTARSRYEESISLERDSGATAGGLAGLAALANLGHTLFELGELALARERLEECLAASLRIDDRQRASACLHSLGMLALHEGLADDADEALRQGLAIAHELGIVKYQIDILLVLGAARVAQNAAAEGVGILACAEAQAAVVGMRTNHEGSREAAVHDAAVKAAFGALGPAAFQEAYATGREWTLEEGVAAGLAAVVG